MLTITFLKHVIIIIIIIVIIIIIRPPGTLVPEGLMFYRRCFFVLFLRATAYML